MKDRTEHVMFKKESGIIVALRDETSFKKFDSVERHELIVNRITRNLYKPHVKFTLIILKSNRQLHGVGADDQKIKEGRLFRS